MLSLGGLAVVVALVGPWPIPMTPPAETEGGRAAIDAVGGAGVAVAAEARAGGRLFAGFARREFASAPPRRTSSDPFALPREFRVPLGDGKDGRPEGAALAGYGVRAGLAPAPAEGVVDPCSARAIALRQGETGAAALVLGADLLYVGERVREAVLRDLARDPGIGRDRVLFTATHTHSAPGNFAVGLAEAFVCGFHREDVAGPVAGALVDAARAALADLAPAELHVARSMARGFVRNRYWRRTTGVGPDGAPIEAQERVVPLDADLTVFRFRAPGGALRGLLAVYGAHATVIGPEVPRVSADWPGGFERFYEEADPRVVALYAAGPVGSQAPRAGDDEPDPFLRARRLGEALARSGEAAPVAPRGSAAYDAAPGVGLRTVEVPFPPISFRLAPSWRASPLFVSLVYPVAARAPVSVLRLGRDLVVGFPAEISGQLSLDMKGAVAERGLRLTAISFAGGYHGYVPPDACYWRFRYENVLSLHGPHFGAFLVELAKAAAAAP